MVIFSLLTDSEKVQNDMSECKYEQKEIAQENIELSQKVKEHEDQIQDLLSRHTEHTQNTQINYAEFTTNITNRKLCLREV